MSQDRFDRLLERYCAGDVTSSERAEVDAWAEDPANAETLRLLGEAWRTTGRGTVPADQPDVQAAWLLVRSRIENEAPVVRTRETSRLTFWRRFALPAAAAAAVTLTLGGGMWAIYATRRVGVAASDDTPIARVLSTRRGERSAFDLPDGSRVVLAPETSLRVQFDRRSNGGARNLFLDGEAYFEVKHDELRPFRVYTATGIAEEFGNERGSTFLVTSYPETIGFEAIVTGGAAALRTVDLTAPALVTLTPGTLGQLDETETAAFSRNLPLASRVAWVDGSLAFEHTSLRSAALRLGRWYDIEIQVENADLRDRELTVAFRDETARQALAHVASLLDADLEWRGRTAVLRSKRLPN